VLVAVDGVLETSEGKVSIPTICLEEDAARIIEDKGDKVTYRLDRLGIPLIEVATGPDIVSPEHARETAERIGLILRATGRVKRGLGTIRQDLNVSIQGGERIEVKGVQELRAIPKLVENEVRRQLALIEISRELSRRKGAPKEVGGRVSDVTGCFTLDERPWVRKALAGGAKVLAAPICGFAGLLGRELMSDYRFGTELSYIAKASAGVSGILHSDEEVNKAVSPSVKKALSLREEDAWVAIVGLEEARIRNAFDAIHARCRKAFLGVPKETRKAEGEKTVYMRPLPGSHRMYPETDELPIKTGIYVSAVKDALPRLPEEKIEDFRKLGLGEELASQLVHSAHADTFTAFIGKFGNVKPSVVAQTLLSAPKEAKKRFNAPVENLSLAHFEDVLSAVDSGIITKDVVVEVLRHISENPGKKALDVIAEEGLGVVSGKRLEEAVVAVSKGNPKASEAELLGKVMAEVKGRARAEEVQRILKEKGHS
jgi:glutamyl-tRNA(Gln) amidotransferase subunit E